MPRLNRRESGRFALQKASDAAPAATAGGRVTGTEINDEESSYEIEVALNDGSQVDVQLDEAFAVVGSKTDNGGYPRLRCGQEGTRRLGGV